VTEFKNGEFNTQFGEYDLKSDAIKRMNDLLMMGSTRVAPLIEEYIFEQSQ
jgi:hypothetical protein